MPTLSITDFSPACVHFTQPQVKDHPVKYIEFYLNNEACRLRRPYCCTAVLQEGGVRREDTGNVRNWAGKWRARLSTSGSTSPRQGQAGQVVLQVRVKAENSSGGKWLAGGGSQLASRVWLTQTRPGLELQPLPTHSQCSGLSERLFCMLISQGK